MALMEVCQIVSMESVGAVLYSPFYERFWQQRDESRTRRRQQADQERQQRRSEIRHFYTIQIPEKPSPPPPADHPHLVEMPILVPEYPYVMPQPPKPPPPPGIVDQPSSERPPLQQRPRTIEDVWIEMPRKGIVVTKESFTKRRKRTPGIPAVPSARMTPQALQRSLRSRYWIAKSRQTPKRRSDRTTTSRRRARSM